MTLYSQTSIKQPPSRKGQIPGEPKGRWEGVLDQYLGMGEPLRVWNPDPVSDKKSYHKYSRLSLNGHLYKTDTSLRWTLSAGPKGVRLKESWLYPVQDNTLPSIGQGVNARCLVL